MPTDLRNLFLLVIRNDMESIIRRVAGASVDLSTCPFPSSWNSSPFPAHPHGELLANREKSRDLSAAFEALRLARVAAKFRQTPANGIPLGWSAKSAP